MSSVQSITPGDAFTNGGIPIVLAVNPSSDLCAAVTANSRCCLWQPLCKLNCHTLKCREDTIDDTEMMRRQMNPMGNQMAFDAENAFKGERAALAAVSSGGMLPCLRMALMTLAINCTLLMVQNWVTPPRDGTCWSSPCCD